MKNYINIKVGNYGFNKEDRQASMNYMFLVQYEPLTTRIIRVLSLTFESKPTQELIEHFYDEVNASDPYHNSIVFRVQAENINKVREQIIGTFNVLYEK